MSSLTTASALVGSANDLWKKAVEALSKEDKENIDFNRNDKLAILDDVLATVDEKKRLCIEKRWKYKKGNREIVMTVGDCQIFGAMVEGVQDVANIITRYRIFEQLYLRNSIVTKIGYQLSQSLVKLYAAILRFLSKARRYYAQSTATRIVKSVAETAASSVAADMSKILSEKANVNDYVHLLEAEYRQNIESGVQNIQSSLQSLVIDHQQLINDGTQRLKAILTQLEKPINRSTIQLSDLHDSLKMSERQEVIRWMSTIPHKSHHKAIGKGFLDGSGQWLLQERDFDEWRKSSASSVLWLHGIPGSGKTKLVYSIIEYIGTENSLHDAPAPIAYFYCVRSPAEPQRADPDEIMRSILKQLSCSNSNLPIREPVTKEFQKRKKDALNEGCEPEKLSIAECEELILALLEHNPATIVIDALDECDPLCRHELLKTLDNSIQQSANLVKIFVSSRNDNDIVCWLTVSPNITIQASKNGADIISFVHSEVNQAIENKRLLRGRISIELKHQIITTLLLGAQGMFRWVSLQIQALCNPQRIKHEKDIIQELGRLPKSLKDSYDVIYELIEDSGETSRGIAENTIKWLLCAQRPLKHQEFIAAISVNKDGHYVALSIEILLDMCCNLVVFDAELDVFRFAHLSVREYVEGRSDYTKIAIHVLAAERCLDPYLDDHLPKSTINQNDILVSYASMYWPIHYRIVEDQATGSLKRKMNRFLLQGGELSSSFKKWSSLIGELLPQISQSDALYEELCQVPSKPPTPIFTASFYGLVSIIDCSTPLKIVDSRQKNKQGHTCLTLAAKCGQPKIVKKLLTMNFDVNDRASNTQTALHLAAKYKNFDIVKILLSASVDVNAVDENGNTALHYVARHDNLETMEILLSAGADVNPANAKGETALHLAALRDNLEITEILLSAGADVNAANAKGETALHFAASSDRTQIVNRALFAGAEVNAVDDNDQTALHMANVYITDENDETTMHCAIRRGDFEVMKTLISAGADVNAVSRKKKTPLHYASTNGNLEIMKTLISAGAEVNATDRDVDTPLHHVTCYDNLEGIRILLSAGANVHAVNKKGETALHIAKDCKSLNIVEELRKAGAEDQIPQNHSPLTKLSERHPQSPTPPRCLYLSSKLPRAQGDE